MLDGKRGTAASIRVRKLNKLKKLLKRRSWSIRNSWKHYAYLKYVLLAVSVVSNYQVPVEVRPERRTTPWLFPSLSSLLIVCAKEIDAANTGAAVDSVKILTGMAEANRAFRTLPLVIKILSGVKKRLKIQKLDEESRDSGKFTLFSGSFLARGSLWYSLWGPSVLGNWCSVQSGVYLLHRLASGSNQLTWAFSPVQWAVSSGPTPTLSTS